MKQRTVQNALQSFWNYANTNVGAVLIGASASYLFTKGSRERELLEAKHKIESDEQRLLELEKRLQISNQKNIETLQSKTNYQFHLGQCLKNKTFLKYAFDNSLCVSRQKYSEDKIDSVDELKKSSQLTNLNN